MSKRFAKLQGRGYAAAMVNGTITMEVDEALFRAGQIGMDDGVAAIKKIQANAKERNAAADELRKKYAR